MGIGRGLSVYDCAFPSNDSLLDLVGQLAVGEVHEHWDMMVILGQCDIKLSVMTMQRLERREQWETWETWLCWQGWMHRFGWQAAWA